MRIGVVGDKESFESLTSEWNALLENSSNNTLFLRWEWMFHYYNNMCNGQELFLMLVRDDKGHLKGIAPFILREERIITKRIFLELIGQRYSYHLGIIADRDNTENVHREVCAYLFENRRRWDLISFVHLSDDEMLKKHLRSHAKGRGYVWREGIQDPCKVVQIRGSFDEYVSSLKKAFSKALRKRLRRIKREFHVELSLAEDERELMLFWRKFLEFHIKAIDERGSATVLSKQRFQRFYHCVAQAAYREGSLALMALKLDSEIFAVKFAIVHNRTCHLLNTGYKRVAKHSLWVISTVLAIERLLESGVEYFDFGGGGGGYKEKLGGVDKGGLHIEVVKRISAFEQVTRKIGRKVVKKVKRS